MTYASSSSCAFGAEFGDTPAFLRNPTSLLASQREVGFSSNTIKICARNIYFDKTMATIGLRNLCRPAMFYFVISIAAVIFMAIQNLATGRSYCIGMQKCSSNNVTLLFVIKIVYILFWTWLLNIICSNMGELVSWVLVFIPFILMFIFIAITFLGNYDFDLLIPSFSFFN